MRVYVEPVTMVELGAYASMIIVVTEHFITMPAESEPLETKSTRNCMFAC